jgi:predicted enzyme related to lactoylglutathione lyase
MTNPIRPIPARLLAGVAALALVASGAALQDSGSATKRPPPQVSYLEIVTPDRDATCALLAKHHGVTFGEAVAVLGNARTADLAGGGRIGVRAPMSESERPVVRPYLLVKDIHAAVAAAEEAGAEIAHPPLELPGQGTFAIYYLGGVEHGLWMD